MFYSIIELYLVFWQVILAANDFPSINDVTYPELIEIIAKVIEILVLSSWISAEERFDTDVIMDLVISLRMRMGSLLVLMYLVFWLPIRAMICR